LKPSTDNIKHNATIFLAQYGGDATPTYTLKHPDPASPESRNRYAAALYDSYFQDILFGEVLLIPEWTQPNPTPEQLRLAGGVPPAPQPIMPHEFAIQLYNPDQQVIVKHHPATWNSASYWEFEMPMQTFRQPSTSTLDRTQSDPTASETTPKIGFKWKKEKLSKDLICNLSGKSMNPDGSKRKNKEPDIPVAFFSHLKTVTIYEPNLTRVDMEDPKGLEVVLLLCAAVIKDVYFSNMKEAFNISETPRRSGSGGQRNSPPALVNGARVPPSQHLPSQNPHQQNGRHHHRHQDAGRPSLHVQTSDPRPPPTDPRSQWEIDLETHRLKKQVEHEEKARKKAEQAEMKRVKQMLEAEERETRRKQADIDKETDRLRREYAAEQRRLEQRTPHPPLPPRQNMPSRHSAPIAQQPYQRPQQQPYSNHYLPPGPDPQYLYAPQQQQQRSGRRSAEPTLKPKRSSFFQFMTSNGGEEGGRLHKKQSSIW